MTDGHDCIRFDGGVMMVAPTSEYPDSEVEKMRRSLARSWGCKLDMVTDEEAIGTLRQRSTNGRFE